MGIIFNSIDEDDHVEIKPYIIPKSEIPELTPEEVKIFKAVSKPGIGFAFMQRMTKEKFAKMYPSIEKEKE